MPQGKRAARVRRMPWERLPWSELMRVRLRDLGVSIEGSWLEPQIDQLRRELLDRALVFQPTIWLSEEWFSPLGIPGFAAPFYLAHPRLMRLERSQMLDVEGGTHGECMRILRHETGHAIQHAYRLHHRRRWRYLFGSSAQPYPDQYRPNPASKQHVQHLRLWYAQSHPDEDFAETFAVWMRPRRRWRKRYAAWPIALRKLEYVDELMAEVGGELPLVTSRAVVEPLHRIPTTLGAHYDARRRRYVVEVPNTYDRDLQRLFSRDPAHRAHESAAAFLRRHRTTIRQLVARWSGEYQITLDAVLTDMIVRCRELRLRAVGAERPLVTNFAVLLAVTIARVLYSRRREWIVL
jgi:hypothetical protein